MKAVIGVISILIVHSYVISCETNKYYIGKIIDYINVRNSYEQKLNDFIHIGISYTLVFPLFTLSNVCF